MPKLIFDHVVQNKYLVREGDKILKHQIFGNKNEESNRKIVIKFR